MYMGVQGAYELSYWGEGGGDLVEGDGDGEGEECAGGWVL